LGRIPAAEPTGDRPLCADRPAGHWGFFVHTLASELDGNDIRDNGNGTFTTVDVTQRYSPLDQYLMDFGPPDRSAVFSMCRTLWVPE